MSGWFILERMKPNSYGTHKQETWAKEDYEIMLVATIEQEFEHNVAQQICLHGRMLECHSCRKTTAIQSAK
jgi:hypothetical protein